MDSQLLEAVLDALFAQSGWEWLGASLGILYVVLAANESIWCWPAAFASTLIYTVLFWEGQLPMQALLNAYYLGMAVYGYWVWKKRDDTGEVLQIAVKPLGFHIKFVALGTLLTLAIGGYLSSLDSPRLPYLDAAVTVFSVMNTLLMARKVMANWLYWLVINSAAIALYWQTGYYVTIVMFIVYFVLAIYGYLNWRASYQATQAKPV